MPLYIGDYLADTADLTTEEHGAYLLLLMHYWNTGPLTTDPARLANICKMSRHKFNKYSENILRFFSKKGNKYLHGRLDREISKAVEISEKRADAGRVGGLASAKLLPTQPQPQPQPQPPIKKKVSSTPKKKGSRIPDNFTPNSPLIAWAEIELPLFDWREETKKFIDYWKGIPGQRGLKLDWDATWRNWMRKANDTTKTRQGTNKQAPRHAERSEQKERDYFAAIKNA